MNDTTEREAVMNEFGARKGWVDSAIGACKEMADEIVRLRNAIQRVRALHFVEPDDPQWCYECNVVMPCPTLRALDSDATTSATACRHMYVWSEAGLHGKPSRRLCSRCTAVHPEDA